MINKITPQEARDLMQTKLEDKLNEAYDKIRESVTNENLDHCYLNFTDKEEKLCAKVIKVLEEEDGYNVIAYGSTTIQISWVE